MSVLTTEPKEVPPSCDCGACAFCCGARIHRVPPVSSPHVTFVVSPCVVSRRPDFWTDEFPEWAKRIGRP